MAVGLCLLDSNILIRWVQPNDPDYSVVATALQVLASEQTVFCYTSQNLAEFWNACTRPADRNGYGLTPADTDRRAKFFESKLRLLPDGIAVHQEWRRILVSDRVSGIQVHDAHLVAVMRIHGVAQILTFNRDDFSRYAGISAVHPGMVVARRP